MFFPFLFFLVVENFRFRHGPVAAACSLSEEFGGVSGDAGAIATLSRSHKSKERRNPRLGEGSGGAEKRGAASLISEIYLPAASSKEAKAKKKGKKHWHPSAVGKASGSARKRPQTDEWIDTRHLYPLQQIDRQGSIARGGNARPSTVSDWLRRRRGERRLFFFLSFFRWKKNEKEESAQCPASRPEL